MTEAVGKVDGFVFKRLAMLGLLLIFFVGKSFYDLAKEYEKNKWVFALVGVVAYYAGTLLIGVMIGIAAEFGLLEDVGSISTTALSFVAIPAGILSSFVTYRLLRRSWSKAGRSAAVDDDVLDSEFLK